MDKIKRLLKDNRQFIVFILLMSVFRSAVADWYSVPTGSMQPTIEIGDRITVNKMAYDVRLPFTDIQLVHLNQPQRGDIVVFESAAANERLIKRVIGLPGDVVSMQDEILTINGKVQQFHVARTRSSDTLTLASLGNLEHTVKFDEQASPRLANFAPVTVPQGHYLVLGDNRRNSADSRVYGFVPHHELRGKAQHVAFSLDYDNYYLPRKARLFNSLY